MSPKLRASSSNRFEIKGTLLLAVCVLGGSYSAYPKKIIISKPGIASKLTAYRQLKAVIKNVVTMGAEKLPIEPPMPCIPIDLPLERGNALVIRLVDWA